MKTLDDFTWKRASDKHIQRLMILLIRIVEIVTASLIPSFLGILLVFFNPGRGNVLLMSFVSFLVFTGFNCWFTIRFVRQRPGRLEFYAINGIAYAVFIGLSVLVYFTMGDLSYTVIFSDMRMFEAFGASTAKSLIITHGFVLFTMIMCEVLSRLYYRELYSQIAKEGMANSELIDWDSAKAMQSDKAVKLMSVDEVYSEIENDRIEAEKVLAQHLMAQGDDVWDKSMVKGRGNAVEFADDDELFDDSIDYENFEDFDNTEEDSIASSVYDDYDPDSLWNPDIYKGRTKDEKPIYDYDDEPEEMQDVIDASFAQEDEDASEESLWDAESYRGRGTEDSIESLYEPEVELEDDDMEYETNSFEDYDVDNLWGNIVQGRNNDK